MTDAERAVVVFGGSSGIGLAAALRLAADGGRLLLVARDTGALERAAEQCRAAGAADVRSHPADVLDSDQVGAAFDTAVEAFGRVDAVVHTATVMGYGEIERLPTEVFLGVVDTAVRGTFHVARAALAIFRRQRGGTLVVVNSLLGSITVPNMGAYSVSKWAQRALVRTLQQEVRGVPDVNVCMLSPGSINTPIYYLAANYTGRSARPPVPVLQPERAGAAIVGLIEHPRNNVSIPVGPANPIVITGFRVLPWVYDRLVGPLFRMAALTRRELADTSGNVLEPTPDEEELHGHWPQSRP